MGRESNTVNRKADTKVSNIYFFLCSNFSVILGPLRGFTIFQFRTLQRRIVPSVSNCVYRYVYNYLPMIFG